MLDKIKVLIADDEPDVREIMAKWVKNEGYEVVTAGDGAEAWEKIQKDVPDIILLDLMMPQMNGFEVLKNLRENPPTEKWQPVIIISALGELEDIKKGLDLEADHYITKPCSLDNVLKAIRIMVSLIPQRRGVGEDGRD